MQLKYNEAPQVSVGIMSAKEIDFVLNAAYKVNDNEAQGQQKVSLSNNHIVWNGEEYTQLSFQPCHAEANFSLHNVTIGVNFHWEQQQTQTFKGTLRLVIDGDKIVAINQLSVEDYLESVISSEMSATSSPELLKAHAVISRSWLLAQIQNRDKKTAASATSSAFVMNENEIVKWYDREDHTLFDVCADDHCQRYQGITKATSKHVAEAVQATRGLVLLSDEGICDARFSKCCGGMVEEYRYCWEDEDKPYLKVVRDHANAAVDVDLTNESNSDAWIRSNPDAFCNTHDARILSQVLNDFDQTTTDFYRWRVEYTQEEVGQLLKKKLGIDFGLITAFEPLERGKSGRISRLKIVGTKRTLVLGKELEIRRALSESHLYSSAFVVDVTERDAQGQPLRFVFIGAGWGHGVGLCQIGAAVMGEKGYPFHEILAHYYPGAEQKRLYP
ncbi:SpoIID/LytB domain-containing protein [Hoylesella shahii]|jgi:hypothetical protein|uniref:SpoIID/LytB domain protein n=1 Tax=Hoylesella shahii DSM 15611 = JCM 12083 TaxID=1122991 RepID=A0A318HRA9_9BACT|nr:SpoIID/LytB domain-containing protein [Hoylesella shahii]PXX20928.1 SpoIID/LytB domain protein [Hoylesella shahii DSM 15611 = JCM 12083]